MAMLHKLVPGFIEDGRLYWLKAPLYKAEKGKTVKFFYSEEEFQKYVGGGNIVRYKGLGQMSDNDLAASMFGNENQMMEQMVCDSTALATLEDLMGNVVAIKKSFVMNNIDFGEFVYG